MVESSKSSEAWSQCPAGELQRMATQLTAQRQRSSSYKRLGVASGLAVAMLAVALVWQQASHGPVASPLEMTCDQVKPLLANFAAGAITDQTLAAGIERHLDVCPPCAAMYQRLVSDQLATFIGFEREHFEHGPVDCECCPHAHVTQLAESDPLRGPSDT